jgi:hypothetical protein
VRTAMAGSGWVDWARLQITPSGRMSRPAARRGQLRRGRLHRPTNGSLESPRWQPNSDQWSPGPFAEPGRTSCGRELRCARTKGTLGRCDHRAIRRPRNTASRSASNKTLRPRPGMGWPWRPMPRLARIVPLAPSAATKYRAVIRLGGAAGVRVPTVDGDHTRSAVTVTRVARC